MSPRKVCSLCEQAKPIEEFGRWYPTACRPCAAARRREYYSRRRVSMLADRRAWREANPEKKAAHRDVRGALKKGILVRPSSCEACGCECLPHGHHDDYTQTLDVRWLCTVCHAAVHSRANQEVHRVAMA